MSSVSLSKFRESVWSWVKWQKLAITHTTTENRYSLVIKVTQVTVNKRFETGTDSLPIAENSRGSHCDFLFNVLPLDFFSNLLRESKLDAVSLRCKYIETHLGADTLLRGRAIDCIQAMRNTWSSQLVRECLNGPLQTKTKPHNFLKLLPPTQAS